MKFLRTLISLLLALLFGATAGAQTLFSGRVVDSDGLGVIGAGVVCSGRPDRGTVCDEDGSFRLEVPKGISKVEISALGMQSVVYDLENSAVKDALIVLEYESTMLDQVVVTGYAQTTVKRITGSVGILNSDSFKDKPLANVTSLMQGEVAGVQVQAVSGQPGTQSRIRIRGTNNLSGSSNPLWVVDGVPLQNESPNLSSEEMAAGAFDNIFISGIGGINPNDIESITILKDAAAAAIYGSRAANGVIVVTTKRGSEGRLKLSYSNNFTWSFRPQRNLELMDSGEKIAWEQELWDEFAADRYAAAQSDNTVIYPVVGIVGQVRAGCGQFAGWDKARQDAYLQELASSTTDWYGELFRNAFSHNHHLSLSGGSDKAAYYISLGYNDDNGMLINNRYQRYNVNSSLTMTPARWIKLDIGNDFSRQSSKSPDSYVDAFKYAYFANPYEKVRNEDGSWAADNTYFSLGYYNGRGVEEVMPLDGFNILKELELNSTTTVNISNTLRAQADIRILEVLKFVGLLSWSYSDNSTDKIVDASTYTAFRDRLGYDDKSQTKLYGSITQNRGKRSSYVARGHFAWNQSFGRHTLNVIAGAELRGSDSNTVYSKRYNYNPITGTSSMPSISGPTDEWVKEVERLSGEYFTRSRYASFYASADYFLGKTIVLNASVRTDGSSNFGSERQFNPTWSAGAAWHLGEEKWMQRQRVLSHATLRAAYGFTGDVNTSAPHYLVMQYALQEYRYVNGKSYMMGSIPTAPNPDLGWEKTRDAKLGIDLGFLKDRLCLQAETYYRLSTDVVTSSRVASTSGYTYVYYNSADLMNSGVEFTLNGKIVRSRDWNVGASLNFAYNYNKVLSYKPASSTITAKDRYVEGYPVGAIISGRYEGIDPVSGLYNFRLRPDAEVLTPSDLNDPDNYRWYLGTTIAPFTGGFNINASWKLLRLSVSGVYSFGNKVYEMIDSPASYLNARHDGVSTESVQSQYSDLYSNHLNVRRDRTSRWTESNSSGALYPRIYDCYGTRYNFAQTNPMDWNIVNAIYLKDVSYLRIKSIVLSCELPQAWLKKIRMEKICFNLSLNNMITISSYDGMDPEVPGATYPTTRSVSLGVSLGF
ncbi:MAG: SusC/RagA family TonB-linked outer membrane protein [Candidatus Cryptobacteroides sp.]|nr:SusC/RagA family TonB-linked outer membrane protein [Candidatus Cryptobacteroides sp.]